MSLVLHYVVRFKILVVAMAFPVLTSTVVHKFYVSVTQIEYVEDQKSVQIITRLFIDDLEKALRERYDEGMILANDGEPGTAAYYIEKYLKEKISISIDGQVQKLTYIGKEYEDDIMIAYLEIYEIPKINTLEISNEVLFDLFDEQQNIVRTKIKGKNKSFILIKENAKGVLNFD